MKIKDNLTPQEIKSIKDSFFHIYHAFLDDGYLSKDFVGCLFKWGVQLHISETELKFIDPTYAGENIDDIIEKEIALEHLYNLVYIVYIDDRVEDIELEVVSKYAEKLGFQPHIVNDLLKTIVTAPYDGYDFNHVKNHIQELLQS